MAPAHPLLPRQVRPQPRRRHRVAAHLRLSETTRTDLLELHDDSGTSWTVPGHGRDLNTAVVDGYANSVEPPIRITQCPPGTQSMDLAERGQKRLVVLANPNLHSGRLGLVAWEDMFFAAQGQLDLQLLPGAETPGPRTECRLTYYSGLARRVGLDRSARSLFFFTCLA